MITSAASCDTRQLSWMLVRFEASVTTWESVVCRQQKVTIQLHCLVEAFEQLAVFSVWPFPSRTRTDAQICSCQDSLQKWTEWLRTSNPGKQTVLRTKRPAVLWCSNFLHLATFKALKRLKRAILRRDCQKRLSSEAGISLFMGFNHAIWWVVLTIQVRCITPHPSPTRGCWPQ